MNESRHTPESIETEMNARPIGRFFIPEGVSQEYRTPWDTYEMSRDYADSHRDILREPISLVARLAISESGALEPRLSQSVKDGEVTKQTLIWLAFDQRDHSKHSLSWQIQCMNHHLVLNSRSIATRSTTLDIQRHHRMNDRRFLSDEQSSSMHNLVVALLTHPETVQQDVRLQAHNRSPKITAELTRLRELQMQRTLFAHEVQYYMSLLSSGSYPNPPWRT